MAEVVFEVEHPHRVGFEPMASQYILRRTAMRHLGENRGSPRQLHLAGAAEMNFVVAIEEEIVGGRSAGNGDNGARQAEGLASALQ